MSRLHIITICHMEPEIVAWSLMRYRRTTRVTADSWTLLDNYWPIGAADVRRLLHDCHALLGTLNFPICAGKNLGGHGGITYVLNQLEYSLDDLVLVYDPDSNPVSQNWLEAMLDVMNADPTLGYVSLLDNRNADRPWTYETIGGHKVAFIDKPEMWNVTLFRASSLTRGMLSDAPTWGASFYGHVETAMFRHIRAIGMRNGYMFDYREDKCPIEHPKSYQQWKQEHAYGKYPGNFDEYCKERGIK